MSQTGDEPLGYLLHRLAAVLRPRVAAELGPLGLGLPEFVCLRILAAHPGRTSAELARATHVTAQATNQLLHRLEALGAVNRPDTAAAGRALPAELTDEGRELLAHAECAVAAADNEILAGLTATEGQQLRTLLAKAGAVRWESGCPPITPQTSSAPPSIGDALPQRSAWRSGSKS